ncbi:MAG TPA: VWA domain-containing protein [Bacteroidetes bacterium]|nr:VWA domain-containing protein [Bacteroidota bacterium]
MFRFEHSYYLYAFALLPVLLLLYFIYIKWRKRAASRLGETSLVKALMPDVSKYRTGVKFSLLLLALSLLFIGWANPQWGSKREKVKRKSVDVLIALDISTSMFAQDIPPNRLERAKRFAEGLVDKLKGERIGLILFAGSAYLQMPVTTDYAAAKLFLRSASPNLAGSQGTVIGDAIGLARRSFADGDDSHKALIIITDGEDHDGQAVAQAEAARDDGIFLFTVGVGTQKGSFIPINIRGREDYKRDQSGQPVRSKLNEEVLAEIAKKGGGSYFNISAGDAVADALQARIDQMEKRELEVRSFTEYNSYFQYFIAAALLLLLIEFLLSYRKKGWVTGKDLFGN